MVQRLLTVKTRRSSQKTILATIVTVLPVYWLYLLIGTLLYVFYAPASRALPLPQETKEIFPHFVRTILPAGLKGLVLGRDRHGQHRFAAELADRLVRQRHLPPADPPARHREALSAGLPPRAS